VRLSGNPFAPKRKQPARKTVILAVAKAKINQKSGDFGFGRNQKQISRSAALRSE
jgi:hypothetical protein